MRSETTLAVLVTILGASGVYLLLPHKHGALKPRKTHAIGAAIGGMALLFFATFWKSPVPWVSGLFFYVFAFGSVICAVLTVTSSHPVHSALWFAAVVLATSGLFLQAGASFLAAGTVIVYAGAIIVTFLFVIMLAQMEGRAVYDRAARSPFWATLTCFMLFFGVTHSLLKMDQSRPTATTVVTDGSAVSFDPRLARASHPMMEAKAGSEQAVSVVLGRAIRPTATLVDPGVIAPEESGRLKPHMAGLGETLYTDHLIVVELVGALLFMALVGALSIASPRSPVRPTSTGLSTPVSASTGHRTTVNV